MEVTPAVQRESSRSQESSSSVVNKQVDGALIQEKKSNFSSDERESSRAVTSSSSVIQESSTSSTVIQQSSKVVSSSSSSLQIEATSEEEQRERSAAAAAVSDNSATASLPTSMDQDAQPADFSISPTVTSTIQETSTSNKEIEQEHIKSALQEIITEIEEAVVCAEEKEAAAAAAAAATPGQPWQVHRPEGTITLVDRQTSTTTLATEIDSGSPVEAAAAFTPPTLNGGNASKITQISPMPQLPPIMFENQQDGLPAAKPLDLEKIFTPADDSGEISPSKHRRMYASSSFYAPNHPTVEDQLELARRISHSLSDSSNRQSKGQSMYVSRKKRSVQWIHGDQTGAEESEETVTNGAHAPSSLKLIMDPRGQVQDLSTLRRQGINVETPLSPDLCFDLVRDLNSPSGKGAELFAKRRRKSEKWVVDESNVRVSGGSIPQEPQTPCPPQTPGGQTATLGTPTLLPSYLDPGRAQHQARLIEIQQRFSQPRLKMVKSPWDAALETGSVDTAFQELPPPRGFVLAPVPEVIDSWQELHPAPSPLPPAPPVVASATPRTFPEPSSLSGVYAPKVARGWTPSRPSQKPVTSVPGPLFKTAPNSNIEKTIDTNSTQITETNSTSNIFQVNSSEAADFDAIYFQEQFKALDENATSLPSIDQVNNINTSSNTLTQSTSTIEQTTTVENDKNEFPTSSASALSVSATAAVEEKRETISSEVQDIQIEAGVSYESQSFDQLMERFETNVRPQLKYKQVVWAPNPAASTVIGTQNQSSAPSTEAPQALPASSFEVIAPQESSNPPKYYVAEASVQVRTFDQPLSESHMQQQELISSSSHLESSSKTSSSFRQQTSQSSKREIVKEHYSSSQQSFHQSSSSQKQYLQQRSSSQQQYLQQSSSSKQQYLQQSSSSQQQQLPQSGSSISLQQPATFGLQEPLPPQSALLVQPAMEASSSALNRISWTNYNTAPRGWSQNQHYYRPVTFNC